jgi:flagellar motor switch protein FliM
MPLGRLLNLQVGETLFLNQPPEGTVELRCGEIPLSRGRMGKIGRAIAVCLDEPLSNSARQELLRQ